MGFNQRHALDVVRRPTFRARYGLKKASPPYGFFRRFRLGNIKREWMLELGRIGLKRDECDVEQRSANLFALQNLGLAHMQTTRAERNHCVAGLDADGSVAL